MITTECDDKNRIGLILLQVIIHTDNLGVISIFQPVGPAAYQYQWEVSDPDGNNFYGHGERRDGEFTSGSYFVLLPDGRRQRVDYTVSPESGYVATVTYDQKFTVFWKYTFLMQ